MWCTPTGDFPYKASIYLPAVCSWAFDGKTMLGRISHLDLVEEIQNDMSVVPDKCSHEWVDTGMRTLSFCKKCNVDRKEYT